MVTQHWAIYSKADMLRVKWIQTYIIKEHCVWSMAIPNDAFWTVEISKIKHIAQPRIQHTIGDGCTCPMA